MVRKKETVEEYMKRGGKVTNLPYVKDYTIDYFSRGKIKPSDGARLRLAEFLSSTNDVVR